MYILVVCTDSQPVGLHKNVAESIRSFQIAEKPRTVWHPVFVCRRKIPVSLVFLQVASVTPTRVGRYLKRIVPNVRHFRIKSLNVDSRLVDILHHPFPFRNGGADIVLHMTDETVGFVAKLIDSVPIVRAEYSEIIVIARLWT